MPAIYICWDDDDDVNCITLLLKIEKKNRKIANSFLCHIFSSYYYAAHEAASVRIQGYNWSVHPPNDSSFARTARRQLGKK